MELFFPVKYFMELFFSIKCFIELFFFIKYFMELCDEVELVYQRLRVFLRFEKAAANGGVSGIGFRLRLSACAAAFHRFVFLLTGEKPVHLPHALRGWIL